jgi:hypothetical protein
MEGVSAEAVAPPPPPPAAGPLRRVPLVGILACVGVLELVLNRIVARLLHQEFLQPRVGVVRALDDAGFFIFQLLSALGVMVMAAGILRVMIAGSEFRPGARASLPVVGGVFVALAGLGLVFKLPGHLLFHLHLSFLFLALLLVLAVVASHASWRVKLGAFLLYSAAPLRLVPQMIARLQHGTVALPEVYLYASLGVIVIGALLVLPPARRSWTGAVVALVLALSAAVLVRRDWETAARVAGYGFGVELPIHPLGQLAVIGALATVAYTAVSLLSVRGVHRLRGWGVGLLTLGGLGPELPYQMVLLALGFLCLAESAVRSDARPISREAFDGLLRRAAGAVGTQQVSVTGTPGAEVARLTTAAAAGTLPVSLVVNRRAGAIVRIDITVGEAPPREPPFVVERRDAPGLGPHESGARVLADDPAFDRVLALHDRRGAGAALLDDDTRKRMLALVQGWLAVWPQRGIAYRATALPSGDEALAQLIAFLRELAQRTA